MKVKLNIFLVSTCFCAVLLFTPSFSFSQAKNPGVNTIVIDAGHGGKDPGTVFGNYLEKDINLSVALMLGDMIKENLPGVNVIYTRDTDVFIPLNQRGEIANKANADLFLSIHVNAVDKGKTAPSGALTLVMGVDKAGANLDIAMRENDVIKYEEDYSTTYEGYVPGSTESYIIFSLMQYINIDQSLAFADLLQQHYKKSTPIPDRGVRQQGLLVLWKTTMPGVLTELGFLSNAEDRAVLTTTAGQKKMATALFNAFSEYKSRVEGQSHPLQIEVGDDLVEVVPTTVNENRSNAASASSSGIVYRVQILSAAKKVPKNSTEFKSYRGKVKEFREDGRYRYCVGECSTYSQIADLQAEVRREFPDAFMVAYDGDRRISVDEARRRSN